MEMPKSKYEQTKQNDAPRVAELTSVQDVLSVVSIDDSGIFELPGKRYSKLYALSDINFAGVTDEEQKSIIINFSKVLKAIPCRFSYTVANEHVDERAFHEKVLYPMKGDKYDSLRKSYNKIIADKVSDAKQGLYQTIYLTLTIKAEDMADAKSTFSSMESAIRSAFIGIGVNGIQGSVMRSVGIDERMQLLFNLMHAGIDHHYQFSFERELKSRHDWMNIICPASLCFENEGFTINGQVGRIYFVDEYPKSLESDIISALTKMNCTSFVTVANELLDISGFKQEIARKYMAVGMKIENEKQRNRNNNDYLADASAKLLNEKDKLDAFSKKLDTDDDHYFNSTMLIFIQTKDEEELTQIEEKLMNAASLKSVKLKTCFGKQREAFNTVLPLGIQEFKRVVNLSSSCLAMLMPFKTQELNDANGIYYGINQLSQNVIFADKKLLKNHNGLILGQSGSGKSVFSKSEIISTFVNYAGDQIIIIDDESVMICQENAELFDMNHPDLFAAHVLTNSGDSKISYELGDLTRAALLVDLDRVIVGEVKEGQEAAGLSKASMTGHKCWTSVHDESCEMAVDKMADYISQATGYSTRDSLKQLQGFEYVVHLKDFHVDEIVRIAGWDKERETLIYEKVYPVVKEGV